MEKYFSGDEFTVEEVIMGLKTRPERPDAYLFSRCALTGLGTLRFLTPLPTCFPSPVEGRKEISSEDTVIEPPKTDQPWPSV